MSGKPPAATNGDTVVYVELVDEGVDVQRPVLAKPEGDGYRLPDHAPNGEQWSVAPGSLVRCEQRGDLLLAIEAI